MEIPKRPGIYIVIGLLPSKLQLMIKSFGTIHLSPGLYCYCGSARGSGGLRARIGRHLKMNTKKFWHFDYFKTYLQITQVWWQTGEDELECGIAQFLADESGALVPVNGFGSSDCRNGCVSHLIYFPDSSLFERAMLKSNKNGFNFKRERVIQTEIG